MVKFYLQGRLSPKLLHRSLPSILCVLMGMSIEGFSQTDTLTSPQQENVTAPPLEQPATAPTAPTGQGSRTISGKVIDKTGEAVIGAVVSIKGTNIGTTTDENGAYTLVVPEEHVNGTMVISYVGYRTVELPLATTTNFEVTINEDNKLLDEVVVVGYGTQEKEDVTGAISSVKAVDLNRVVVPDPGQAIQGRAPGVTVTQNTGSPGSPVSIRVRGVGTIGNSNPYFVVNGVPVDDISYLNSNDIASIDVLKDASSAAIYGNRAANGIVLITTKGGSPKKTSFDFNVLTGVSSAWRKLKVLDAKEWATLKNEALLANGSPVGYNTDTIGAGTNWQDQIFEKASMQSYHLGASGGTEKSTYYFGGGYLKQGGIVKESNYERYNFNTNLSTNVGKRFRIGTYANVAFSDRLVANDAGDYESVISSAIAMDPLTGIYAKNPNDSTKYAAGLGDITNPLARVEYRTNKEKRINFLGNFFGEYTVLKYIKLKSSLGYGYNNSTTSDFRGRYFVKLGQSQPQSVVIRDQSMSSTLMWENSINFERTFADVHKVEALGLWGYQGYRTEWFRVERQNTSNNDPSSHYFGSANGVTAPATGVGSEYALLSYLGRVRYEFKNKYLFSASVRRDESSRFPKDKRAGYFPAVALGWKISEEGFWQPYKSTVSFFKLRGGWGIVGNQNVFTTDYPYTTNITTGQNYAFGNNIVPGLAPRSIGNPNIRWEKVTTTNIAIDLGFFRDRLLFTADYFVRTTNDMLIQRRTPGIVGLEEDPTVNGGKMSNRGLEMSLEYRNLSGPFTYRFGGNITFIKNEVLEIGDPLASGQFRGNLVNRTQNGSSVGEFYGLETDGIVQTQEEANALQNYQPGVRPGEFKYKDINGDGRVTLDKDRTAIGSPIPKFTYGINAEAQYKNFDIVLFFQGVYGNKIFNGTKYVLESPNMNNNYNKSEAMLDRWTGPGSTNERPAVQIAGSNLSNAISNYYVESGSYLRLKVFQLGYTIPSKYTERIKMERIRIFVGAQNLLTFTKYSGLDPEIGQNNYSQIPGVRVPAPLDFGIDRGGNYPQARTWQFGISASF